MCSEIDNLHSMCNNFSHLPFKRGSRVQLNQTLSDSTKNT